MYGRGQMNKKKSIREICRCPWVDLSKPDYVEYHDTEWGVPVYDDRLLFEFLTLESAQAGLSWYTVLKKRENYRIAFENFEPDLPDLISQRLKDCYKSRYNQE
jgi:3-methyladenine DNA glycosylase Tag